jgi:hypothetical protein
MTKARHVYQAIIRSALSYGAALWHKSSNTAKPKGMTAKLQKQQNQGLRIVLVAFKATPARQLETESYVPPLDLWLNGHIARFQARREHSGIAQKVRDACKVIRSKILRRTARQRRAKAQPAITTPGTKRKLWVEQWIEKAIDQWDWQAKKLVHQDWEIRWHKENRRLERIVRPGTDPGNRQVVPEDTPPTAEVLKLHEELRKAESALLTQDTPPTAEVLKLHEELRKAESALLTQARTKKIALSKFLHRHKVPGFSTATCQCRARHDTPRHMALFCMYEADRRHYLHVGKKRTYTQMVGTKDRAKHFVCWMMYSGRPAQFSLAKRLLYDSK